jgi:glycosyltransferase involved in cell wall biosynthesis
MSPLKLDVVIDGRALVGNRTGIGVHTANIAARLGTHPPPLIASHAPIDDRGGIEQCRFRVDRSPLGVLWQQVTLPRIVPASSVLWAPHGTLPVRLKAPAVATVHDLTSITMPLRHELRTILSFNVFIGRSLEQARFIAAVSRATADAVMRGFGIAASKIVLVPNGVDSFFRPPQPGDEALPEGLRAGAYILYAGTIEPRKGVGVLLDAWRSLPEPRPTLVLAGDAGWKSGRLMAAIAREPGIRVTGFVPCETLRALYQHAAAFVYPSYFEGFGMPPLEAMACGTPVITTRGGALPETVGDAAMLVDAGDAGALSSALRRLLAEPALAAELVARGHEQVRQFDWDVSAGTMRDLLGAAGAG